jgi:hypothetical protein
VTHEIPGGDTSQGGNMGGEIVFNVAGGQVTEMPATTLKGIGCKERADLSA